MLLPPIPPPVLVSRDIKEGVVKLPKDLSFTNMGVTNTNKYIIGTSFSPNGTAENRANYTYGSFIDSTGGDIPDTFRDACGKYWTFTDDNSNVVFLNDSIGPKLPSKMPNSDPERAKIPFNVYCEEPVLIDQKAWAEYDQVLYITPDINWLWKTFAQGAFNQSLEDIKQELSIMTLDEIKGIYEGSSVVGSGDFTAQELISTWIRDEKKISTETIFEIMLHWWKQKMAILPAPSAAAAKGPCGIILQYAALSNKDSSISNQFGAQEICSPWINPNNTYVDHVIDSSNPIAGNQNELLQMNLGIKTPFFSVSSEYNFYIDSYEDVTTNTSFPVTLLPNMYVFVASFASKNVTDEHSDFLTYERIISLDGIVKEFSYDALRINENDIISNNNLKKPPASSKQYFNYWSSNLQDEINRRPNTLSNLKQSVGKNQRLVFYPMQDADILQNYNDQKFMFPMYNEIEFSTGTTNVVGDTLRQTALTNHFMRYYAVASSNIFSDFVLTTKSEDKNLITEQMSFVEVANKLSVSNFSGDVKTFSEIKIDTGKGINTTNMTAFLASIDFGNVLGAQKGDVSNFGLTNEQIDYIKAAFGNNDLLNNAFSENSIFVSKDENEKFLVSNPSNEMQRVMLSLILYGKMKKLEKAHHRSFSAMMMGESNYSETVMYVVKKRLVKSNGEPHTNALQEYFFLNSSKTDVLDFIDTQVVYNVQYQYDIDAIVLSIGMSYEYGTPALQSELVFDDTDYKQASMFSELDPSTPSPAPLSDGGGFLNANDSGAPGGAPGVPTSQEALADAAEQSLDLRNSEEIRGDSISTAQFLQQLDQAYDTQKAYQTVFADAKLNSTISEINGNVFTAKVTVRYRPDYRLLRVPYGSSRARVLDKPPIFPDALITPYKGKNNKILINLNQNVGEYFMKPIFIDPQEREDYLKIADSQKIKITDSIPDPAVEYKSDDPLGDGGYFEVYRIDKKPETYLDFADSLLTTIDGHHETAVGHLQSDSASLNDNIKPNRKYYYMFRVVDAHGHTSNPSPIFEIEMVDDGGTVYMVQNIIELQELELKEVNKTFKKYLQIKPVFHQTLLNVPRSDSPLPSAFDYGKLGTEGEIKLGSADTALWGKKFKIRITSKSSGKQIDVNVTFSKSEENQLAENTEGKIFYKGRP